MTWTERRKRRMKEDKKGFPIVLINCCTSDIKDSKWDHQEKWRVSEREREAEVVISGWRPGERLRVVINRE